MKIILAASTLAVIALANPGCPGNQPTTPQDGRRGQVVFTEGQFDELKKYKTWDEFKAANKVVSELVVNPPQAHLAYYAVFSDPLGASEYIVQIFDRTEVGSPVVHAETKAGKAETSQATGGWGFEVPVWPPPADAEKVEINEVWIKPGHQYEVVVMKPLARGTFTVKDVPVPAATAAPAATPKGGKGVATKPKGKTK